MDRDPCGPSASPCGPCANSLMTIPFNAPLQLHVACASREPISHSYVVCGMSQQPGRPGRSSQGTRRCGPRPACLAVRQSQRKRETLRHVEPSRRGVRSKAQHTPHALDTWHAPSDEPLVAVLGMACFINTSTSPGDVVGRGGAVGGDGTAEPWIRAASAG